MSTTVRRASACSRDRPRRRSSSARRWRSSRTCRSRSPASTTEPVCGSSASGEQVARAGVHAPAARAGRAAAARPATAPATRASWSCRCRGRRTAAGCPRPRSQPAGYCVCRRGSSARATWATGAGPVCGASATWARSTSPPSGSGQGRRGGGRPARAFASAHRVDQAGQVGRPADVVVAGAAVDVGRARGRAEQEGAGVDGEVGRLVGDAGDERRLDRHDLAGPEPDEGASRLACGRCAAASPTPMTSLESPVSCTRRAIRRFVFALMFSLTAPDGRCVASTRCTPRVRPRWAMPTSDDTKSGSSAAMVANSSMTTTRRGIGSASGRRR